MITDTYTRNMCVCETLQSEIVMDTNTQLLHTIVSKLENLDTRLCAIEAQGERHEFVQPKAKAKAVKAVKANLEANVYTSEGSQAHHEMKASLKAMPKAKQKSFTKAWKGLQKASKYPTGTMPKPLYFKLQMQAYNEVA